MGDVFCSIGAVLCEVHVSKPVNIMNLFTGLLIRVLLLLQPRAYGGMEFGRTCIRMGDGTVCGKSIGSGIF